MPTLELQSKPADSNEPTAAAATTTITTTTMPADELEFQPDNGQTLRILVAA